MYRYFISFATHNTVDNIDVETPEKITDVSGIRQIEATLNDKGYGVVKVTNIVELSNSKKPFFFRLHSEELYLIPAEIVNEFDSLLQKYHNTEKDLKIDNEIVESYGKYKVEYNFILNQKFYFDIHSNEN